MNRVRGDHCLAPTTAEGTSRQELARDVGSDIDATTTRRWCEETRKQTGRIDQECGRWAGIQVCGRRVLPTYCIQQISLLSTYVFTRLATFAMLFCSTTCSERASKRISRQLSPTKEKGRAFAHPRWIDPDADKRPSPQLATPVPTYPIVVQRWGHPNAPGQGLAISPAQKQAPIQKVGGMTWS